jgi:oligopeptide/dipeptide ABC transporter ATP-binding protein
VVEQSKVDTLFEKPYHPYTQGLIGSISRPWKGGGSPGSHSGNVPNLIDLPVAVVSRPAAGLENNINLIFCCQQDPSLVK